MKSAIILLFALLTIVNGQAQHPFIEHFGAEQVAGGIFLRWTLKAGSICKGIQIERELINSGEFQEVGDIEGVCGDTFEPVSYTFLDTSPRLGETNTYRLGLGGFGSTGTIDLFAHDFANEGYALIQDLNGEWIRLLPKRAESGRLFIIYTLEGKEQLTEVLSGEEETQVDISGFSKGMYVIQVLDGDSSVFSSVFLRW
ncbi:MAG: hypothetical protein O2867_03605 [Bacteroidetes bacterium]|nr:hypothetical protein [Bacteroidota bacterium]MDA0972801.1 hypothetical protein [Bacteroidota bacterium]